MHVVQRHAVRRTVAVNGKTLTLLQHFFDTPVAQEIRIPRRADLTGMKVWPTALKLLDRLACDEELQGLRARAAAASRPLRVLELGSGTGVLGLGFALLGGGPTEVVVTDPNLPVNLTEAESASSLEWLQANVEVNREEMADLGARVEAHELEWSNDGHHAALRAAHPDDFDMVLGSELLYDPDNYAPLLHTLRRVAAAPHTLTVLGHTIRHGAEARFRKSAAEAFVRCETHASERAEAGAATPWEMITLGGGLRDSSGGGS